MSETPPTGSGSLSITQQLSELRNILRNLPESLPDVPHSQKFPFQNYSGPSEESFELVGSISGAINRDLEIAFGFNARSSGDGTLPITERGASVCALVDVLEKYQQACDDPESDGILLKWIEDVRAGAQKAYVDAQKPVSSHSICPLRRC